MFQKTAGILSLVVFCIIETGRKPLPRGTFDKDSSIRTMEEQIYLKVSEAINKYEKYLEPERPFVTKNSCGYYIWDLLTEDSFDLTPLLVGSEGTLALVSEATLKLSTIPEKALSGVIYFDDLGNQV